MGVTGYIIVTLQLEREGDQWVGRCIELGTATCGDTLDETLEALREAVLLHLNTLEDVGECRRFLTEHGIRFYGRRPATAPRQPLNLLKDEVFIDKRLVPVLC